MAFGILYQNKPSFRAVYSNTDLRDVFGESQSQNNILPFVPLAYI
jgi:hypothetical protein